MLNLDEYQRQADNYDKKINFIATSVVGKDDLIVADMLYYLLEWTMEQDFNRQQSELAVEMLLSIYLELEQKIGKSEDVVEFVTKSLKSKLLSLSTQDPPGSIRVYSLIQSQKLFNYICDTFIRNLIFYVAIMNNQNKG